MGNYLNFLILHHSLLNELIFHIFLNLPYVILLNDLLLLWKDHLILILLSIFILFFYFFFVILKFKLLLLDCVHLIFLVILLQRTLFKLYIYLFLRYLYLYMIVKKKIFIKTYFIFFFGFFFLFFNFWILERKNVWKCLFFFFDFFSKRKGA